MSLEWAVSGYTHVRELGEGSAGRVILAVHNETDTPVAIKYLSSRLSNDAEFTERFRDEARLLAEIDDPNLVRFFEYVETRYGAAIVMELINGVSLADLIKAEGPTGPEAALLVLKGSLLGLSAAHISGVVHRDFKPGNVLVRGDGVSKLADFGIAVRAGDDAPAAGTPAYMAPEQWRGVPVTPAADVYAATAVFYECLTGERPFPAKTLPQLAVAHRNAPIPVRQVPEPLRDLVLQGMAKDPADRPVSAAEHVGRLEGSAATATTPVCCTRPSKPVSATSPSI
jgi:serine/threonine protein kinase